ncbi:MAG: O-antigen ligase family protein [Clostridia bacterium]|nr:O-antigen ligase family protein [Clostridia bacterium]
MSTAILKKSSQLLSENPSLKIEDLSGEQKSKHAFINKLHLLGDKFLYSRLYMLLLGALVFLCWFFEKEIIGVAIVIMFASIVLIARKDTTPLIAIIFVIAMIFPRDIDPLTYGNAFYFFIPLPIAIVIHFMRFRVPMRVGKMFFPQLAVSVALFVGGIGTIPKDNYITGLTYVILLGVAILFFYFLFYLYAYPPKNVDFKMFIANLLNVVGTIIVMQVATRYIQEPEVHFRVGSAVSIGWGCGNNFATILLFTVGGTMYLAAKSKASFFYLILAVLQYVAIVLGWSRGATLFAAIILPMYIIALFVTAGKNRKYVTFGAVIILAFGLATVIAFHKEIFALIDMVLAQGTGVSGRDKLYAEAIEVFLANPIFGAGVGFYGDYYRFDIMPMYWFHSTLFQVIGSMGIIGILAYAYYYYARYRVMVRKKCAFSAFMIIGMIGFEGYSMIDTGTFVPIPIMIMVILMTLLIELDNKSHPETFIDYKAIFKRK